MRAKVCGITNLADAQFAMHAGFCALGFNFYEGSPRCLNEIDAINIIGKLPSSILKIGLFIGKPLIEILQTKDNLGLDLLQVYEDFNCDPNLKKSMILTISPLTHKDVPCRSILEQYAYVLIDAPSINGILGGTGKLANWEVAKELSKNLKVILAGGLTPSNIATAIDSVNPHAVDVCSSVEAKPGSKDFKQLQAFIKAMNHEK